MNLFTNCVKYNKPGGSIHMQMHMLELTDAKITCQFIIEDTGLGMSEDSSKTICSGRLSRQTSPLAQAIWAPDSACLSCSSVSKWAAPFRWRANSAKAAVLPLHCRLNSTGDATAAAASTQTSSDISGARLRRCRG